MPSEIPAKRPSAAPCARARSTWKIARRHAKRTGRARRELSVKTGTKTEKSLENGGKMENKHFCWGYSQNLHGFPGVFHCHQLCVQQCVLESLKCGAAFGVESTEPSYPSKKIQEEFGSWNSGDSWIQDHTRWYRRKSFHLNFDPPKKDGWRLIEDWWWFCFVSLCLWFAILVFDDWCGMFLRSMLKFGWVLMIVMGGVLTQGQLLLPEEWEQAPSQRWQRALRFREVLQQEGERWPRRFQHAYVRLMCEGAVGS